eukprot:8682490-Karenia_brevis.AAC.1
MTKGKAADRKGIVAEMIQMGSMLLLEHIADLFTKVLRQTAAFPSSWYESYVSVLFKKGDARLAENYRPITLLPILYKLFSRVLRARVQDIVEAAQGPDQAGFRKGFACDDHLLTM